MDFRQLEYIVEIAKENNISRAAKNLFISQSALNQQLLKLESELGTQLFHRSRTDWRPTEAGEIYLRGAKEALLIKKDTYSHINDITHSKKSELRLGLTPGRGIRMFTAIYPELHRKFRDLVILPIEMNVRNQQKAIAAGELDLGFMTLTESQRVNASYITLGTEEMTVLVPQGLPVTEGYEVKDGRLPYIDIRDLREEPFTLMYKHSTMRDTCDQIFENAGILPHVIMETSSTASLVSMVGSMLCCSIVPRYYVGTDHSKVAAFILPEHPSWDLCISYRKKAYLTDAAKEYIRLAKRYWGETLTPVQED